MDFLIDTRRQAAARILVCFQHALCVEPPSCCSMQTGCVRCTHCGAVIRVIALIDEADVVEPILKHLKVWDPPPETIPSCSCL